MTNLNTERSVLWTTKQLEVEFQLRPMISYSAIELRGISYLPERVQPGDVFVNFQPNTSRALNNVGMAISNGALAVISEIDIGEAKCPIYLTRSLSTLLQKLAADSRVQTQAKIAGITGRAGKTFIKEALSHVLRPHGSVIHTEGNDNDRNGVRISVCRLRPNTSFGVFEISMGSGAEAALSVAPKAHLTAPEVAIVSQIGTGIAEHESYNNQIAETKSQIFSAEQPPKFAVINIDDSVQHIIAERARRSGVENLIFVGIAKTADVRLLSLSQNKPENGWTVELDAFGEKTCINFALAAKHNITNSLQVLAAAHMLGVSVKDAGYALSEFTELPGRGLFYDVPIDHGRCRLFDFTRSAELASICAGIRFLSDLPVLNGRRIAILGDVPDLGDESPRLHSAIASLILEENIDLTFTVGTQMSFLWQKLDKSCKGVHCSDSDTMATMLKKYLRPGDVAIVQGWRQLQMNRIIKLFLHHSDVYVPW